MDEAWLAAWHAVKGDEPVPGGAGTLAGPWQGGVQRMFALSSRDDGMADANDTSNPLAQTKKLLQVLRQDANPCHTQLAAAFDHGSRDDKDGQPHADRLVAAMRARGEPVDGMLHDSISPERVRQLLAALAPEAEYYSAKLNNNQRVSTSTSRRLRKAANKLRNPENSTVKKVSAQLLARAAAGALPAPPAS
eukprot:6204886-Prymnesium_polylepis.1